ncbi:PAS domain S-box protein [Candidatus Uhrbacteria bacterium]|nr:PAS domain S-box protein [Candidatus Uhrbacteria bacterium]
MSQNKMPNQNTDPNQSAIISFLAKVGIFLLIVAPVVLLAVFDYNQTQKVWERLTVYDTTPYYRANAAKPLPPLDFATQEDHLNFILASYILIFALIAVIANYIIHHATKQKQFELKQQEDNAKTTALLESIGEGVMAADYTGKILVMNKAAQEMTGLTPEKIKDKALVNVLPLIDADGNSVPNDLRPSAMALASGHTVSTDKFFYPDKNGNKFPVAITVSPIYIHGRINGFIAVSRNISREKEIDQAKSEFVSLASHQLKTPLAAIRWNCEMLLNGDAGKLKLEQHKIIEDVYLVEKNMKELVEALLNVSRLELGVFMVEPEPTNVPKIIYEILQEVQHQITDKKISVLKNFSPDVPILAADPKLVRVVLDNLITNAIKYTPAKGTIRASVRMAKERERVNGQEAASDSILVEISDSGLGIPKEQQSKIFSKLFRADNVRASTIEGTGLGLYIVKTILDKVGGQISFQSQENKGTTFSVLLPISGMQRKSGSKRLT